MSSSSSVSLPPCAKALLSSICFWLAVATAAMLADTVLTTESIAVQVWPLSVRKRQIADLLLSQWRTVGTGAIPLASKMLISSVSTWE